MCTIELFAPITSDKIDKIDTITIKVWFFHRKIIVTRRAKI